MMKRGRGIAIVLLSVFCLLSFAGCSGDDKRAENKPAIVSGTAWVTHLQELPRYREYAGTVSSQGNAVVGSQLTEKVKSVFVREGDFVKQGQLLAQLDPQSQRYKSEAAAAGALAAQKTFLLAEEDQKLATSTFLRYKDLYAQQAISSQLMDEMENRKERANLSVEESKNAWDQAAANLQEAEVNRSFCEIRAPLSGKVRSKFLDPGSLAVAGTPLFVIESETAGYLIETDVDEDTLQFLSVGTALKVRATAKNGQGQESEGTVAQVIPFIDQTVRKYHIKVAADDRRLFLVAGAYVKVLVPEGIKRVLIVPNSAIISKGQLTGVYAIDEQQVLRFRIVKTGEQTGDQWEIISGLNDGDVILAVADESVHEGDSFKAGE